MSSTRRSRVVVAAASALLLTGCASDSSQEGATGPSTVSTATSDTRSGSTPASTTGTAPGATGPVDATDAVQGRIGTYSVLPPEGWGEATDEVGTIPGVDLVLMSSEKVAGFNTNLVVHVAQGDAALLETELAKGRDDLAEQGRSVSDAPEITVSGSQATGFTTSFSREGVEVVARSYGLVHEGQVYLLTLSSAKSAATQAAAELAEIVETWTWG